MRAAKVASTLTAAGHEVHLVARNRTRRPQIEVLSEATVHRLAPLPLGALDALLQFPAFFNPRWFWLILQTARRVRADVILVRDLPLAPLAIVIGRYLGIPVLLDMAENYPAMMSSIFASGVAKPIDFIVRNPRVVRMVERWVLKRVDQILVVVEESRDRLVALGVDEDRITLVSNTPPLARVTTASKEISSDGSLHLVYLGLLEAPRGLGIVLDALAICRENDLAVQLTVVGEGRERAQLEHKAASLGLLGTIVKFRGFLPNDEALMVVAKADVGLVPHHATESWNSTIPNKLFDYMAAGLPVLSSDARPCARVVGESMAGLVYEHDSADALFRAIRTIADPSRRERMSANGPVAIREKFSWEHDSVRLLEAINGVRPDLVRTASGEQLGHD